jgi:hypothetical protein
MIPENTNEKKYWYRRYEGYESRIQRRLKNDLGIDEAAADTILHLRNQIIELQSRLRQLEAELASQHENQNVRLVHSREVYYEAVWVELDLQE